MKKSMRAVKIRDVVRPKYSLQIDGITQGLIMCYLKCRREFLLRLNEWGPQDEKPTFANGAITHDTLDKVYTFYQLHKKLPKVSVIRKWVMLYDQKNPTWLPKATLEEKRRIKEVCFVMVTEYIRFYKKDFGTWDLIGAEDIFDIKFHDYRLRGKKDLRYRLHGSKFIMETKTMARIDEGELVDKIAFDFQSSFYTFAEELEDPEPVVGVLYNIVRNPGHKPGKDESLLKYCGRLRREVRKDPGHFFKRFHIMYSKLDKLEFKKELLYKLQEIEMYLNRELQTYKNEKNCVTRFQCTFLRACASGVLLGYAQKYPLFKELQEV